MLKKLAYMTFSLLLTAGIAQAGEYTEGVEYTRIAEQATESGDKIEVLEFFWYGCPHCYQFEPVLEKWLETKPANVEFIRVPAVFRPEWKVHARTYYALQAMELTEKYHSMIFEAMHKDKIKLYSEDAMINFLISKGVDEKEFRAAYASFSVDNLLRKAIKKVKAFGIRGVPALGVNGKYLVSGREAGTYENMLRVMDHLIKQEAAATAAKK